MTGKIAFFAVVLAQIVSFAGCRNPSVDESVAHRLECERKLKLIAGEFAPFVVSLRSISDIEESRFTGFFVDPRGYIVTARHGYSEPLSKTRIEMVFSDGRVTPLRVVGDIQTLDMAVLATDSPVAAPVAEFGDLSKIMKRGTYYGEDKSLAPETRMVVVRCVNKDDTPGLERINVGELSLWEKLEPVIVFTQRQQNMGGCSGSPIINLKGEVLGMFRSTSSDIQFGIDAPSIKDGAGLLIKEDIQRKKAGKIPDKKRPMK